MAKQDERQRVLGALRDTALVIDAGTVARDRRATLLQEGRDAGISDEDLAAAAKIGRSSVRTLLTRRRAST